MNGEALIETTTTTTTSSDTTAAAPTTTSARVVRKPRPEIQIYRPGALRQSGSSKNLAHNSSSTNEERPPRPDKLATTSFDNISSSRRRSNDTDSVTSRGGSGSTTPDANAMNEKNSGRSRFENRRNQFDTPSNYDSTQSLYDTRQQGGYMNYNGSGNHHYNNNRSNRNGRYQPNNSFQHHNHPPPHQHQQQQQHHRQPFERSGNYSRDFSERASMRGDGAIARRSAQGSRRQRNDSINSTQSEMPAQTAKQLHIDTSFDSVSQCGASSNFSMSSLGEAFSFEEMCQNLQSFASMDWSKEVENESVMQKEHEEEEERRLKERELQRAQGDDELPRRNYSKNSNSRNPRGNRNRRNNRYDESDRESSISGSIVEENEDALLEGEEELRSGERTPTSVRSSQSFNPRTVYQRTRGNDENLHENSERRYSDRRRPNHHKDFDATPKKEPKERPRRYRGEHDDRDSDTTEYNMDNHMTSGRLAGRITFVPRAQVDAAGKRTRQNDNDQPKAFQKRSDSEMTNRAEINRRRQEEIERNEGKQIREIGEKIEKLAGFVKKKDVKAAEKISETSLKLANIYSQVILQDVIYSFTAGLEQKLFRQAFYRSIESLRTASNSTSPDARLLRAATLKFLLSGIVFYEQLITTYEQTFHVDLREVLTWPNGFPTDDELCSEGVELPVGSQKFESATQKTAIKSLSRHLISLGDLHRYKSLMEGSENYETSKSCYQKSSQLWPSTGHPYNQLGIVVYYSMLYRSARRARLVPVDVLSKQRQKRVIDEFFYLTRALACSHPYEVARDRLKQRLDAMRSKVLKYQPVLDKECGIVKEQGNELRKLQFIRQIWIHPTTEAVEDGTGERIVDDILSHFMQHTKAKLHRRAVSYLCDTFGILTTKIGMDHFESVSERAFALLYASLSKSETEFSADQLVKLAAIFIHAVHTNYEKTSSSSSNYQLQASVDTLFTYFLTLLDHISTHRTLLLPAVNVISTWVLHEETDELFKTLDRLGPLESSILPEFRGFETGFEDVADEQGVETLENRPEFAYPEAILLASFYKIYEPNPSPARNSRMKNALQAVEKLKTIGFSTEKREKSSESEQKCMNFEQDEEPKSREQMIEEERGKGKGVIVIHPEYLIPDTNVFIDDLQLIQDLFAAAQKNKKFQILVPTIVLDELQNIAKSSNNVDSRLNNDHDPERASKSKEAVSWLKEQSKQKCAQLFTLTTTGKRLPSLLMAAENLEDVGKMTNDDMILQSALKWCDSLPAPPATSSIHQFSLASENPILRSSVLITGDRGLTIKAIGSQFPCRGIESFSKWMGAS